MQGCGHICGTHDRLHSLLLYLFARATQYSGLLPWAGVWMCLYVTRRYRDKTAKAVVKEFFTVW